MTITMRQIDFTKAVPDYMAMQIEQFIQENGVKRIAKSKVGPNKFIQNKSCKKGKWVRRGS